MAYFFVYPFAIDGNVNAIPTTDPGTGEMSYQDGFTPAYELDLNTDPDARPIPRGQSNQLYFDITNAIRQYQTLAINDWIPAVDNLGVAFPYDIYAKVRYNVSSPGSQGAGNLVYTNMVQGNVATPGADNTWIPNGFSLSSSVLNSAAVACPVTLTAVDITSLTVPAGTWAIYGNAMFNFTTGTNPGARCWCSLTSATQPDLSKTSSGSGNTGAGGPSVGWPTPLLIVTVTVPTIVYLSGYGQFTTGTVTASGSITAIPIGSAA